MYLESKRGQHVVTTVGSYGGVDATTCGGGGGGGQGQYDCYLFIVRGGDGIIP